MMTVDDWARRESARVVGGSLTLKVDRVRFRQGIVHAFDALLSDEAVEAAAEVFTGMSKPNAEERDWTRRMLQAAVRAVTEGENE